MRVTLFHGLLAATIPSFSAALTPLVAHHVRSVDVAERRHLDMTEFPYVKGRATEIGNFDLAETFEKDKVLVKLATGAAQGAASEQLSLTATCVSCFTTGTAVVTTDGLEKNDDILGNIVDFIKNPDPTDLIVEALDLAIEVKLDNLGGHFEFNIAFAAEGTFTIPLFTPVTPLGLQSLDGDNKIGLIFTIELILTVDGAVDFTSGFDLSFPDGASFILNAVTGELISMNIAGAEVTAIPITFRKGNACVTAILRIKFEAALALDVFGQGFDFGAGVFFDPLQYQACITLDPAATCPLEFTQNIFAEIGAFSNANVDIGAVNVDFGAPSVVTTFFTGELPGTCLSTALSADATATNVVANATSTADAKVYYTAHLEAPKTSASGAGGMYPTGAVGYNATNPTAAPKHKTVSMGKATTIAMLPPKNTTSMAHPAKATSTLKAMLHEKKDHIISPSPTPTLSHLTNTTTDELITRTIWRTETITITSCASAYTICPSHLATPVFEVITQSYVTICPAAQSSFPLTQPVASTMVQELIEAHPLTEALISAHMTVDSPMPTAILNEHSTSVISYVVPTEIMTAEVIESKSSSVIESTLAVMSTMDVTSISVATGTPILPVRNSTGVSPVIANDGGRRSVGMVGLLVVGAVVGLVL
ncbi:hypothetical protein GLAREA_04000 [Glarea lozoyensis ATCC 20868]|uniref:Uncharacterized protein n=1 Tax=Glarea lozoyensis (strain ATCC 20868 / MF5171) TaxID=1116229 RepID=S3DXD7_GLAL2|nr:uncharacterized protein GLAREA_04000 [Glarea lozoyensis ATCC 20868]EPE31033.1 hypothetical protein GLAREA_04000 [Glarea lozoyensis ATCC 20868]